MNRGRECNRITHFNDDKNGGCGSYSASEQSFRTLFSSNNNAGPSSQSSEILTKRIRLTNDYTQQEIEVNSSEETSAIGLRLRKTPSFLNMVDMYIHQERNTNVQASDHRQHITDFVSQPILEKVKAAHIPASILKIGSWEWFARNEGELVAKCYFNKQKLVWEILNGSLKNKIEVQWAHITAIRATIHGGQPGILEIQLEKQPIFYMESTTKPRRHTSWCETPDFTGGQALVCRIHYLRFPPGVLKKPYEKLLQCDKHLFMLSQKPFPSLESPYFNFSDTSGIPRLPFNINRYGQETPPPVLQNYFPLMPSPSILPQHHLLQNFQQPTSFQHFGNLDSYSPIAAMNQNVNNYVFNNQRMTLWNQERDNNGDFLAMEDQIQGLTSSANPVFPQQNYDNQMYNGGLADIANHLMSDPQPMEDQLLQQFENLEQPINHNNNIGNLLDYGQENIGDDQLNLGTTEQFKGENGILHPKPLQMVPPQVSSNQTQMMNMPMNNNSSFPSHDFSNPTVEDWQHHGHKWL